MNVLEILFNAQWTIGDAHILWREVIGNLFGLASAFGGMRRRVWAWPVGIVGNVLLFTVFLGAVFNTPQAKDLYGQAGRQVFFVVVAVYGWVRWRQAQREGGGGGPAVVPRWAGPRGWLQLGVGAVLGTVAFGMLFDALTPGPTIAWNYQDAWIFTGSLLATYGMARGWTEFWLIWIGVDAVGVPLLLKIGHYPSAVLYGVYGIFVIYGFVVWLRAQRAEQEVREPVEAGAGTAEV